MCIGVKWRSISSYFIIILTSYSKACNSANLTVFGAIIAWYPVPALMTCSVVQIMTQRKENDIPQELLNNEEPAKKRSKLVLPAPQISDQASSE